MDAESKAGLGNEAAEQVRSKPGVKMARKKRKSAEQPEEPKAAKLKPRAFVPRPCGGCTALRPPNTNYSEVTTTRGSVRYCRCRYCSNTWTQTISADQNTTPVVRSGAPVVVAAAPVVNDGGHGTRPLSTVDAGRDSDSSVVDRGSV